MKTSFSLLFKQLLAKTIWYMLEGTVRRVSVKHLVEQGGVFEILRDREFIVNALTIMNDTVARDLVGMILRNDLILTCSQ